MIITIDYSSKQVQYYDSWATPAIQNDPCLNFKMREELERLYKLAFGEGSPNILENTTWHQWCLDNVSCGVFILTYLKRRILPKNFEDIIKAMDYATSLRAELANDLAKS